ncbi:peroxiredoxin [Pararhizobium sp.]|uniref:peroxiredoxin n=1 Tax=Pararhizobium sp. TaxID=1977563 RepID=UPI0027214700|nr:peroxiredoxin [Pararhizobium sp.]MDO9415317.1 peroxiredoxin [Pararhizobium sp.]
MADLSIGTDAPGFTLPRDGGGTVSLAALLGKPVVIFFYPKDNTSSCTVESIDFSRLEQDFSNAGATIVGMSPDSVKSHDKFVKKHSLSVILASDEDRSTLETYGVWKEKSMYGHKYMGVERTTVLVDAKGKIARVWDKVKVKGHADEVLAAVRAL